MHVLVTRERQTTGFTIVELLIVIVVIGILAAITVVAYSGIQTRAMASREVNDLQSLNQAIQLYYVDNGAYPSTAGVWVGWSRGQNFIPGISPKYLAKQPQQVDSSSSDTTYSYIYESNGTDYKLLSHRGPVYSMVYPICSAAVSANPKLADTGRSCWAFGYWSPGAVGW